MKQEKAILSIISVIILFFTLELPGEKLKIVQCAEAQEISIVEQAVILHAQQSYSKNGPKRKYLEIKTPLKMPVRKFKADVTILEAINKGGRLRVQVELLYQPEQSRARKKDMQGLFAGRAEIRDEGDGLELRGYVLACQDSTCSKRYDLPNPSGNYPARRGISLNETHTLGVEYNPGNSTFHLMYDDSSRTINMSELIKREQFDPNSFVRAKLRVFVDQIDKKGNHGSLKVKFDNVYVNDRRYDDFSVNTLDKKKWKTN